MGNEVLIKLCDLIVEKDDEIRIPYEEACTAVEDLTMQISQLGYDFDQDEVMFRVDGAIIFVLDKPMAYEDLEQLIEWNSDRDVWCE